MVLGMIFYYTAIKSLLKGPELASLLATFSFGVILEEVVKFFFTSDYRGFSWNLGKIDMGFTVLPYTKLVACGGSVLVALLLYLWFNKTRAGMAMRSVVEDNIGARVCGVNVDWEYALSFSLGIGLTVASGVLLTMFISVGINPYMGGEYTLKAFNAQDGHAIRMALRAGIQVGVISGRDDPVNNRRIKELEMSFAVTGAKVKLDALRQVLKERNLTPEQVLFVGDDVIDIPIMENVGIGIAVANATPETKAVADEVTERAGGDGAVREVLVHLLKIQGKWDAAMARYYNTSI